MQRLNIGAALLGVAVTSLLGTSSAASLDQFIGFGDSTMDSGYFRYGPTGGSPGLPPGAPSDAIDILIRRTVAAGGTGAFMGPGVVDTIQLAAKFGLAAAPVTIPGGGGTNYANGSAQSVPTTAGDGYLSGLYNNVPIVAQISNYLAAVRNAANPNALYMISFGGNDLTWLDTQGGGVPPQAYLSSLATALTASVATLQAAGARTIVVLDPYAYSRLVGPNGALTAADAITVGQAATYGTDTWFDLRAAGVNFVPADVEGVLKYVSRNPTQFGFTPATELASSPACGATSALLCAPSQLVTPNAEQTYLWSDAHHLTTAGQTIEADYIHSLLTAPSQISLLAEAAVQGGLAWMNTIHEQIDLSGQHRGPSGVNAWISAGANSLSLGNAPDFPNVSGTPTGGTAGGDYLIPGGIIVGAAVTAGGQTQGFSSGGHFTQAAEAASLYIAYGSGSLWGNAIASYGLLQSHVERQVALGVFTDQNNGDTDGRSLALALRGGYDLHVGALTTGPVAGAVLQQVHVNGFTETGTSGVTALAFGGQTQGSVISQLGWSGFVDVGDWQPFAEVAWNHEWANKNRTVTASLTSIAAPSWTADAAPIASDWATASLGVSYKLNSQVILRAAFSAVLMNPQAAGYGGELSLNAAF